MSEEKIIEIIKEKIEYNHSEICEYPDVEFTTALEELLKSYNKQKEELEKLIQDNLDLNRLYKKAAEKLIENGKEELGDYMLAQIGAIPFWTVGEPYKNWINKTELLEFIKENSKQGTYNFKTINVNKLWDFIGGY